MDSRIATYQHIQVVQRIMGGVIADLQKRQAEHDQSKLTTPEVEVFDEYTPKLAASTYGSDEYKSFLAGMWPGLKHHYANNRHHPEYFAFEGVLFSEEEVSSGRAIRYMNLIDLLEMLCDWKAATMRHTNGDLLKSIEINQQRFGYSDELKQILLNTVHKLQS